MRKEARKKYRLEKVRLELSLRRFGKLRAQRQRFRE